MIQPFCDILLYVLHYKDPVKEKSDKFCKNIFKKGMPSTGFDPNEQELRHCLLFHLTLILIDLLHQRH